MAESYAVVDFDGTVADTFVPSPNNMGVDRAYELGVEQVFGREGLCAYRESGALRNRSCGEVAQELLLAGFQKPAAAFLRKYLEQGENSLPKEWPEHPQDQTDTASELLVRIRMEILLAEINESWPLPCLGFPEFCRTLLEARRHEGKTEWAVLSSGHTAFIEKVFAIWSKQWPICAPRLIVSDDDVRHLKLPTAEKTKPSPFLYNLVLEGLGAERRNTVYIGDDPYKDGRLATAAGVPFGWFAAAGTSRTVPEDVKPAIIFADWRELAHRLAQNTGTLQACFGISSAA